MKPISNKLLIHQYIYLDVLPPHTWCGYEFLAAIACMISKINHKCMNTHFPMKTFPRVDSLQDRDLKINKKINFLPRAKNSVLAISPILPSIMNIRYTY
jgi:hypothetical protein